MGGYFNRYIAMLALLILLEVSIFNLSSLEVAINGWLFQSISVDSFFVASTDRYKGSSNDSQ